MIRKLLIKLCKFYFVASVFGMVYLVMFSDYATATVYGMCNAFPYFFIFVYYLYVKQHPKG